MRLTKKDAAALMVVGGIGCGVFAYLSISDGDQFAIWANAISAVWCFIFAVRLWRRK